MNMSDYIKALEKHTIVDHLVNRSLIFESDVGRTFFVIRESFNKYLDDRIVELEVQNENDIMGEIRENDIRIAELKKLIG